MPRRDPGTVPGGAQRRGAPRAAPQPPRPQPGRCLLFPSRPRSPAAAAARPERGPRGLARAGGGPGGSALCPPPAPGHLGAAPGEHKAPAGGRPRGPEGPPPGAVPGAAPGRYLEVPVLVEAGEPVGHFAPPPAPARPGPAAASPQRRGARLAPPPPRPAHAPRGGRAWTSRLGPSRSRPPPRACAAGAPTEPAGSLPPRACGPSRPRDADQWDCGNLLSDGRESQ